MTRLAPWLAVLVLLIVAPVGRATEIADTEPRSRDLGGQTSYADDLGAAVAIDGDGDTAVVGAPAFGGIGDTPGTAGAAVVFQRFRVDGVDTPWGQFEQIADIACGGAAAHFGSAVDISADGLTMIVGAPSAPKADCTGSSVGYVAVYTRVSRALAFTRVTRIYRAAGADSDRFGAAVSLDDAGTRAVIGAPGAAGAGIMVAINATAGWVGASQTTISASELPFSYSGFGGRVAISGDGRFALSGTPTYAATEPTIGDGVSDIYQSYNGCDGVALAYSRSEDTWTRTSVMLDDYRCPGIGSDFGTAVAMDGDASEAAISAPLWYSNDQFMYHGRIATFGGAAAVFNDYERDVWKDGELKDGYVGQAVTMDTAGAIAAAGAPDDPTLAKLAQGTVLIAERNPDPWLGWAATFLIRGESADPGFPGAAGDRFGQDVDLAGDGTTLVVGARGGGPAIVDGKLTGDRYGAVWFFDFKASPPPDPIPDPPPDPGPGPGAGSGTPSPTDGRSATPGASTAAPSAPTVVWKLAGRTRVLTAGFKPQTGVDYVLAATKGRTVRRDAVCTTTHPAGRACRLRLSRGTWALVLTARNAAGTAQATRKLRVR